MATLSLSEWTLFEVLFVIRSNSSSRVIELYFLVYIQRLDSPFLVLPLLAGTKYRDYLPLLEGNIVIGNYRARELGLG